MRLLFLTGKERLSHVVRGNDSRFHGVLGDRKGLVVDQLVFVVSMVDYPVQVFGGTLNPYLSEKNGEISLVQEGHGGGNQLEDAVMFILYGVHQRLNHIADPGIHQQKKLVEFAQSKRFLLLCLTFHRYRCR